MLFNIVNTMVLKKIIFHECKAIFFNCFFTVYLYNLQSKDFKLFTLLAYTGFLCKGYLCTTFRLLVIITRNSYYS